MSKARQPIELIKAKGKKHLTKAEIKLREKSKLKVDLKDVTILTTILAFLFFNKGLKRYSSSNLMSARI